MIKALYWNCMGIANAPTVRSLKHLVSIHTPDLIFIVEPKSSFISIQALKLDSLGFTTFFSNHPKPPATIPALWCIAKNSSSLQINLKTTSNQYLSIQIFDTTNGSSLVVMGVYASTNYRERKGLWDELKLQSTYQGLGRYWGILMPYCSDWWKVEPQACKCLFHGRF